MALPFIGGVSPLSKLDWKYWSDGVASQRQQPVQEWKKQATVFENDLSCLARRIRGFLFCRPLAALQNAPTPISSKKSNILGAASASQGRRPRISDRCHGLRPDWPLLPPLGDPCGNTFVCMVCNRLDDFLCHSPPMVALRSRERFCV